MRSSQIIWAEGGNPMRGVLIKEAEGESGQTGKGRHRTEDSVETEAETGVMWP